MKTSEKVVIGVLLIILLIIGTFVVAFVSVGSKTTPTVAQGRSSEVIDLELQLLRQREQIEELQQQQRQRQQQEQQQRQRQQESWERESREREQRERQLQEQREREQRAQQQREQREQREQRSSRSGNITLDQFNRIRTGMSYQQVVQILGREGEVISEVDLGLGAQYHTIMFQWSNDGFLAGNMNATFQGGRLSSKAQFGLR